MDEKDEEIALLKARLERAEEAARLIARQASDSVMKAIEYAHDEKLQGEVARLSAYFSASCDAMQILADALYGEM